MAPDPRDAWVAMPPLHLPPRRRQALGAGKARKAGLWPPQTLLENAAPLRTLRCSIIAGSALITLVFSAAVAATCRLSAWPLCVARIPVVAPHLPAVTVAPKKKGKFRGGASTSDKQENE